MNTIYQIPSDSCAPGTHPEKLLTIREAADILGVYYWQLQRSVKRGDIPSYTPFNSRKLVKLSEVVAYITSCRHGGVE
ncbi:helix-turn-helix transcriptional regulator [Rhizobium bangladeshense]|uniref:helix-turn-helix transcriptional regulator n=1 Tax=Rhizobium bangladeshense TaxID=1138189 RepID=UPI001C832FEE|nr:helix-turn-helix domain-containing protein [Rhizobium bangladeshense]MBX4916717.1 helix-turn-helix domain-containing protein [Rhizobium bangladeshense]